MWRRILIFVVIAGVLLALLLVSQWRPESNKVSGFIEADEIRIGSRVGGRVKAVHVEEGQAVKVGDTLVELEPFELLETLAQAKATVATRAAELAKLRAGYQVEEIAQAKARVDQLGAHLAELEAGPRTQEIRSVAAQVDYAQAQVDQRQLTFDRVQKLVQGSAAGPEEMDRANADLRAARASLESAKAQLTLYKEGTRPEDIAQARAQMEEAKQAFKLRQGGYRVEDIAEAAAAHASAEAAVRVIEAQIAELIIRAPVEGVVEALELQAGDLVGANAPVLSVMDARKLWVRAYVPENRLNMQVGQTVEVSVDSYPGKRFTGHVTFVARQGEFTPGNIQTPEERSKQVFRIKVTLDSGREELRPGMAADVWLAPPGSSKSGGGG